MSALFAITCVDKPGTQEVRARTRQAHLDYLARHEHMVVLGGVTLSDDGKVKTGSIWVINAADRAAADRFVAAEPFVNAGVFASVTVTRMNKGQLNAAAAESAESL